MGRVPLLPRRHLDPNRFFSANQALFGAACTAASQPARLGDWPSFRPGPTCPEMNPNPPQQFASSAIVNRTDHVQPVVVTSSGP
jgi:hypothetical protein